MSDDSLNHISLFEQYKFIREEVRNEHKLINNRLNISIAIQGFLLVVFIQASQIDSIQTINHLRSVIFFLLCGTLIFPQLGIYAALGRIKMWREKQKNIEGKIKMRGYGDAIQKGQPLVHFCGALPYHLTIPFFILSWLSLFRLDHPIVNLILFIFILTILFFFDQVSDILEEKMRQLLKLLK